MSILEVYELLRLVDDFALENTGCTKVPVGACLITTQGIRLFGCNKTDSDFCKSEVGCLRVQLYGDSSKVHRSPSDCRALHSEIDVITQAARVGLGTYGGTMLVTRYPCEACARTIVASGIKQVYYGRSQEVSKMTQEIFNAAGVSLIHVPEFEADDTTL